MWDPFSHRRGRDGVIDCIPILIGSFRFPEYIPCENFFPKLKNSQIQLYIIMEAYLPHSWGEGGTIGCVSISSDSLEFFKHFSAQNFFLIPKIRKVHEKHKIWLLPPQKEGGWGDRLDPELKLFSGVLLGTSVKNCRSPAQSASLYSFLLVIVILFLFLLQ